jgi:diguanylate cyclase (GGDEF)-like protein
MPHQRPRNVHYHRPSSDRPRVNKRIDQSQRDSTPFRVRSSVLREALAPRRGKVRRGRRPKPEEEHTHGGRSMRILIAEDSRTQAVDLRRKLESLGHEVTVAYDGKQAWESLLSRPFPVAFLDWIMPEMSGVDLCRNIRADKNLPYVYLILLTSKAHRHERLQGLSGGADQFLSKPVDTFELEVSLKTAQRIIATQETLAARIRELEQANEQLSRQVIQDELTGLMNLRGFQQALAKLFQQAVLDRLPLSLIRLELDHPHLAFSEIQSVNEAEFLTGLADLLREARRGCDVAARVGAYGFAMILPGVSADGALEVADSLRDDLLARSYKGPQITASVAVVATTADCRPATMEQLLEAAERAIGQARAEGGNRLLLVEPTLTDSWALSPA